MTAPSMPMRSGSVRWEPFGSGLVLHDEARAEIHLLNPSGALVWEACDGTSSVGEVIRSLAERSGHPEAEIERDVAAHLPALRAAGLVDRGAVPNPVQPITAAAVDEPFATPVLRVLDRRVVIRTNQTGLVDHLLGHFGTLRDERPAGGAPGGDGMGTEEAELGFDRRADRSTRVYGRGHDEVLDDPDEADQALSSLLNRLVASAPSPLALHAGCVRSPEGRVVVLPGRSGSGKSTLTAALVAAGWDYLTDEAAGVRVGSLEAVGYPKPLSLDHHSQRLVAVAAGHSTTIAVSQIRPDARAVLGDGGPVHAIVAPSYRRGEPGGVSRLGSEDALVELAGHAINLTSSGQDGLRTLVDLAVRVPTYRMLHDDLDAAVRSVEHVAHP